MRLTLSSFVVVGTAAFFFAGCGSTDTDPGSNAGSGGRSAAGATNTAGAGTGGSLAGSGGSLAGNGTGGSGTGGSLAGAGGTGGASGGSAGTPAAGGGSTVPATFLDAVKPVIDGGNCSAAPCHGKNGAAPPANPVTLPTDDDTALYNSLTTYMSKGCGNIPLVKKGDGEGSALVKILKGTCAAPTMRMPLDCDPNPDTGNCIPADYIAAISQWITAGAVK